MKTDIAPATKVSGKRVACLSRHWPAPPTSTAQAFFRQASLALLLLTTSSQQGRLRDVPPSTTPYKPCKDEIGPMEDSLLPATATSHLDTKIGELQPFPDQVRSTWILSVLCWKPRDSSNALGMCHHT